MRHCETLSPCVSVLTLNRTFTCLVKLLRSFGHQRYCSTLVCSLDSPILPFCQFHYVGGRRSLLLAVLARVTGGYFT